MKVRNQIILASTVGIIALIIVSVITFGSLADLLENSGWVVHTYNVMGKSSDLTSSMVNQETGMRGYLVTGDSNYLEPYIAGSSDFEEILADLKNTVSDNPVQVDRLNEIEKTALAWKSEAAETFMSIRDDMANSDQLRNQIMDIIRQGEGKTRMDALRVELKKRNLDVELQEHIMLSMLNMETGMRGFVASRDESFLEPFINGKSEIDIYLDETNDPVIRELAEDWIINVGDRVIALQREMNQYASASDLNESMGTNIGKKHMDSLRAQIDVFTEAEESLLVVRQEASLAKSNSTKLVLILGVLISIVVSAPIILFVTRKISNQLGGEPGEVAIITENIAEGNLSSDFDDKRTKVGIYNAIYNMQNNLRAIMSNLKSNSSVINSSSDELSDSVEKIYKVSDTINTSTGEMVTAMQSINASTEEILSLTEEMTHNIDDMTGKVDIGSTEAMTMATQAKLMKKNSEMSQAETKRIYDEKQKAILEALEGKEVVNRIEVMTESISVIANQISLLALNAAIEAARAGEQGRGFAVVADEVRKLSEESSKTVTSIQELTPQVQAAFSGLSTSSEDILTFINDKIIDDYGTFVENSEEYQISSEKLSNVIKGIADNFKHVSEGISEINQGIDHVAATIEEATAGNEEISNNMTNVIEEMEGVYNIAKKQNELSSDLDEIINQFTL